MTELLHLWMPILVATFVCFILSTMLWTAVPLHDGDFDEATDHEGLNKALADLGLKPGHQYLFPFSRDKKHMSTPEFKERYEAGPWGLVRLCRGKANYART